MDEEELKAIVKSGVAETGLPEEQVEHLVSQMITYVDSNARNTETVTAEKFYNWLQEQDDTVLNTMNDKGEN